MLELHMLTLYRGYALLAGLARQMRPKKIELVVVSARHSFCAAQHDFATAVSGKGAIPHSLPSSRGRESGVLSKAVIWRRPFALGNHVSHHLQPSNSSVSFDADAVDAG